MSKHRAKYEEQKEKGVCTRCSVKPVVPGTIRCEECTAWISDYNKKQQQERVNEKLCVACGERPPSENKTSCAECREKNARRMRRARLKKNPVFAEQLSAFCVRHNLSNRKLSKLLGSVPLASKTSVWRLVNGTFPAELLSEILPVLETALEDFLIEKGLSFDEIQSELTQLFPDREERIMRNTRQELTPEAVRVFNLKYDPFDVDRLPAADELFTTPELDALVKRAIDAIENQRFIAFVGEVGTGKTLLKLRIAHEIENSKIRANLFYPEFFAMDEVSVSSIASYILTEFDQKCPRDKAARVNRIKRLLSDLNREDNHTALILDECHRLNDKVISSLKNFWEMTNGASRLLGVILFGQPKFANARLRDEKFREIRERIQIVEMPKLEDAARDYLAHKLRLAGSDINELFEPKAVEKICQAATTPLALGNLANGALMEAFAQDEPKVTAGFEFFKRLARGSSNILAMRRAS